MDRGDKAISSSRKGLNVPGARCGIAQNLPNLIYRRIQAMVEIDEGVGGPKFLPQVIPRDDFTSPLQQNREHLPGLALQTQFHAILAQFSGVKVKFEDAEPDEGVVTWHFRRSVASAGAVSRNVGTCFPSENKRDAFVCGRVKMIPCLPWARTVRRSTIGMRRTHPRQQVYC